MKTIYFIRHGESTANAKGLLAGSNSDTPLTEAGRAQAREAGKILRGKQVDLVVASPLSRAYETAEIIAEEIGFTNHIQTNALLLERDFGTASGQPKEEGYRLLDNGEAVGVEPMADLHARAVKTLEWLQSLPADHIVVASHAGFGRMIKVVLASGTPEDYFKHPALDNASIFEFTLT